LKENLDFLSEEYKVQANPRAINFFYLSENSRARILRNEHGFEVRNTSIKFSEDEMMLEIQNHPENFSPNVILRPLFQETILPNLAFVGGAGELSYWLQLKPIFEYYQINFPALVMRNSMTQINAATERKLSKLKLTPELFFGDIDKLIADFTKANVTSEISLQTEKEKLNSIMDTVAEKVTAIDASLLNNVAAEKQKMQNTLENLEAKLLKAEKRKQEESINQIKAIQAHILPNGNWQERVESFLPNYIEGGKEYIQSMVDLANPFLKAMLFLSPDHTSKP
jgi:bacillithiol biosynthesis cysteine-adding enzyme BshC